MFPSPTQNSRISFVSYSKANVPVTDLFLTWTLVIKLFCCCCFLNVVWICLFLLVKISNFNRAKPRPDIIEEEKMYAYPSHITSEVGFG